MGVPRFPCGGLWAGPQLAAARARGRVSGGGRPNRPTEQMVQGAFPRTDTARGACQDIAAPAARAHSRRAGERSGSSGAPRPAQRAAQAGGWRRDGVRELAHPQRACGNVLLALRDEPRPPARFGHGGPSPPSARQYGTCPDRHLARPPRGGRRLALLTARRS